MGRVIRARLGLELALMPGALGERHQRVRLAPSDDAEGGLHELGEHRCRSAGSPLGRPREPTENHRCERRHHAPFILCDLKPSDQLAPPRVTISCPPRVTISGGFTWSWKIGAKRFVYTRL